jgi:hypothetical protein
VLLGGDSVSGIVSTWWSVCRLCLLVGGKGGHLLFHPLHYRHCYHLRQYELPLSLMPSLVPLLCPPGRFPGYALPVVVPRCPACLVLPTRSAMHRDDEFPIPCLCVSSPPRPSALAAAALPADNVDEVPIPHFSQRPALVSCGGASAGPVPQPFSPLLIRFTLL